MSRPLRSSVPVRLVPAVAALALALLAPGPAPAAAAPVAQAAGDSRTETLRQAVTRAADKLAAATASWETGQLQLGAAVQRKVLIERQLAGLDDQVEAARHRMSTLAQGLYRSQGDPYLTAALAGDPRSISDLVYLRQRANTDAGAVRADGRLLAGHQQHLKDLLTEQQDLARRVTALQGDLDDKLAQIQAQAFAAQRRLEDHRKRLAAAAEAARRAMATCSGGLPVDAANGFLPPAALCPLRTAPGHSLAGRAAGAFDALSEAFRLSFGVRLCVTDSYRSYAEQVDVFARKPNLAAVPGRSNHGWGTAVDLCGGVQRFGTPEHEWMRANAGVYGWSHPEWAQAGGSRPEAWHWEFAG